MGEFADLHNPIWDAMQRSDRKAAKKQRREVIRKAVEQAVASEREACANIAEEVAALCDQRLVEPDGALITPDRIRARGSK